MIKDIIQQAIKNHREVVLYYSKSDDDCNYHHLCDLHFLNDDVHIGGFSLDYNKPLVFRLDRIKDVFQLDWVKINNTDEIVIIDGIYIVACMFDNYIGYEMYRFHLGERFWDSYEKELTHYDGQNLIFPIAFWRLIPYDSSCHQIWGNSCTPRHDDFQRGFLINACFTNSCVEYCFDRSTLRYSNYRELLSESIDESSIIGKCYIPKYGI